jgi:hypothetical protein
MAAMAASSRRYTDRPACRVHSGVLVAEVRRGSAEAELGCHLFDSVLLADAFCIPRLSDCCTNWWGDYDRGCFQLEI